MMGSYAGDRQTSKTVGVAGMPYDEAVHKHCDTRRKQTLFM